MLFNTPFCNYLLRERKPLKDIDNYENLGVYRTFLHMKQQGDNFV